MARRMLPVDKAAVEPRRIFTQRLELGALAALLLRLDAVNRLLGEKLQRRALHAAYVWQHVDIAVNRDAASEFDEPERPAPAQPNCVNRHAPAPPWLDRQCDVRHQPRQK